MFLHQPKLKGQDTSFILALVFFLAILIFLTLEIQKSFPEFQTISTFDFAFFTTSIIGVSTACVLATGIPCAAALLIFTTLNFFVVQNVLLGTLVFIPLTVVLAYVMARLGRN